MAVVTTSHEYTCSIPPARLFKALVLDSHNLIPKAVPSIKSIEIVHGDGGPGSIKQTNFADGSHFKYMKHRVDEVHSATFSSKTTLIEGDALGDKLECIIYEIKIEAAGAGSVTKSTSHYHPKPGVELKEDDIKSGKDKATGLNKAVEEYLLANPDLYA
ncbi:major allergen Mal d 1-like [Diospyros lotus]|uniref:major allergen Mal d 1-like n=1 Tax=Diospyros lotus TaxID=55363 RepID=UPI0022569A92|nr:major allergen Mal d 1-like [Diospyros lotus]